MSERSGIQAQVLATLKQLGIYHMRLNSGRVKVKGGWMSLAPEGTADVVAFPDRKTPVWLECKADTGQSEAQCEFECRVVNLGHSYHLIRTLDDLEPLLKEMR